ncbi:hypothetical protein VCR4J5_200259 [Vibrio crassostreae]|uniref:Uncharacterized protein n=1 Tax=Vibrio crassostreae TaxID=246167 RepID=A0ABM9QUB9_9VIBR|nr:hypothetical protein VCR4J5_200259 [Vibrio crassostreae]
MLVAEFPTNNANVITINLGALESDTTIKRSKLICRWKAVGTQ